MIEALNEIVSKELRWGFWKCFDRLRQMGKPWNHKRSAPSGGCRRGRVTSIPAARVIRFVEQLIEIHGKPAAIRCDNGPELTSYDFTEWCKAKDIELRFIQPGKPDQNAYIERFNRTYREERNQAARRAGKPAASALPRASALGGTSTSELST